MTDSTTPQDDAAMSPASTGSVAGGVVEHSTECVDFWRGMARNAVRIGVEPPTLDMAGVADVVDGLLAEIARLRLTDAEREAVEKVLRRLREDYFSGRFYDSAEIAAVIDGLLERTGGGR